MTCRGATLVNLPDSSATCAQAAAAYSCQPPHDLYLGTLLYANCARSASRQAAIPGGSRQALAAAAMLRSDGSTSPMAAGSAAGLPKPKYSLR